MKELSKNKWYFTLTAIALSSNIYYLQHSGWFFIISPFFFCKLGSSNPVSVQYLFLVTMREKGRKAKKPWKIKAFRGYKKDIFEGVLTGFELSASSRQRRVYNQCKALHITNTECCISSSHRKIHADAWWDTAQRADDIRRTRASMIYQVCDLDKKTTGRNLSFFGCGSGISLKKNRFICYTGYALR